MKTNTFLAFGLALLWILSADLPSALAAHTLSAEQLKQARMALLSAIPEPETDLIFGAAQLRPAWEGMGGLRERKDHFGPGADAMELALRHEGPGASAFWRLDAIAPGSYYLGIWLQTGGAGGEYDPGALNTAVYLNGWLLPLGAVRDPVQVQPDRWLVEVQTDDAVALQPGDEIALRGGQIFRLALYRQPPPRGRVLTGRTFGALRLGVSLQPAILGQPVDGADLEALVTVANPLPYAIEAEVDWTLADHFGAPVARNTESVALEPHAVRAIRHAFVAEGRAQAYQLSVRSRPAPAFGFPHARPPDLLELYSGVRAELVPDLPDPLTAWNHARLNLTEIATGFRRRTSLGGTWQRADLSGRRVPAQLPDELDDLAWRAVPVPFHAYWISPPPDVFGFWYRRTFRVPAALHNQRLFLEFEDGRISEVTVFVNGRRIGSGFTQNHPLRLEIPSDLLRPDATENELVVCTRGAIALMQPDAVDGYDPGNSQFSIANQQHPGNISRHAAHLLGVHLFTRPDLAVRQVLPLPEPEADRLALRVRVENFGSTPREADLHFELRQADLPVSYDAEPLAVRVGPGQMREYRVMAAVEGLAPYTPQDPVPAHLILTLREDDRVIDRLDQRFGHRSFRVRGTDILLNGQPFRTFGYGPNFNPAHIFAMENSIRMTRVTPHGVPTRYDLIGDIGVFHYRAIGVPWGSMPWPQLNNEAFWTSTREAAVEQVWEFGAHPSIVGWGVSNEIYHYAPYSTGAEGQKRHGERLAAIATAIRDATDADFWFLADGDETLGGHLDFCSFHYLNHWRVVHGFGVNPGAFGHSGDGVSHYTPDCFYFNLASETPRPGTEVEMTGPNWVYGSTAFADTESFWFETSRNGIGIAKYVGDLAALSSALQFHDPRGMAWTRTAMEGYRDMGATGVKGIYWQSFYNLPAQSVSFAMPEMELRYFSGARFDRRISVFDDAYRPGSLDFIWALNDPDGREVRHGRLAIESTTATLHRDRIALELPEVDRTTMFTLAMELRKDGQRRAYEEREVEVWPPLRAADDAASATTGQRALFDPSGTAGAALDRLGWSHVPIPAITAEALAEFRVLVVGPRVATDGMEAEREWLQAFADGGGRVLLLEQEHGALLPLNVVLEPKLHASIAFARMPEHPVMAGLRDRDFQFWNPGHRVARGAYYTPDSGVFRTLVDAGHDKTMAWSILLECPVGAGVILAAQMPLVETLETDPMAAALLNRLLAYLDGPLPPAPSDRLIVMNGATGALLEKLHEVRTVFEQREQPAAGDAVFLMDLDGDGPLPEAARLRAYLEDGGALVVHRSRPEHAAWLSELAGQPVTLDLQPYAAWADRQVLTRRDGLLAGLNNLDFYWRPAVTGEGANSRYQVSRPPAHERGQVTWIPRLADATEYLFPGGLVEKPVGAGRLILNQVHWTLPPERLGPGSPTRILSVFLTHLGIARRFPAPRPTLPDGVRFVPVDLSAVANRAFRDEAAGDGRGWIDWGPEADMRSFPTGRVTLHGVPFQVPEGEHNAVVLRLTSRWSRGLEHLPDTVAIPVGRANVAGLIFLHTGGWMFGTESYGRREIEYADGTVAVMDLDGSNTADWNYGRDNFPDETGTASRVAWRGTNPSVQVIRVYQTLWLNPHPDKEIREVRITNAGLPETQWRFLAHLGLSLALLPEDDAPATERDPERSLDLLREALALAARQETAEADARLEAALGLDPRNIGAWMALAEIRAATAEPEAFQELIQRWTAVLPESYQAFNLYGKYLEDRGLTAEALAAYRRSLEIEGNQPWIMTTVERLER